MSLHDASSTIAFERYHGADRTDTMSGRHSELADLVADCSDWSRLLRIIYRASSLAQHVVNPSSEQPTITFW